MHEVSLLRGLLGQIETTARRHGATRISVIRLKLGPLAHIEPDHLRDHFVAAARGTIAESARLDIQTTDELHELTLESMDIEAPETSDRMRDVQVAWDEAKADRR
jgi:hydrogenase nickel incorporation protein HypA/HybF